MSLPRRNSKGQFVKSKSSSSSSTTTTKKKKTSRKKKRKSPSRGARYDNPSKASYEAAFSSITGEEVSWGGTAHGYTTRSGQTLGMNKAQAAQTLGYSMEQVDALRVELGAMGLRTVRPCEHKAFSFDMLNLGNFEVDFIGKREFSPKKPPKKTTKALKKSVEKIVPAVKKEKTPAKTISKAVESSDKSKELSKAAVSVAKEEVSFAKTAVESAKKQGVSSDHVKAAQVELNRARKLTEAVIAEDRKVQKEAARIKVLARGAATKEKEKAVLEVAKKQSKNVVVAMKKMDDIAQTVDSVESHVLSLPASPPRLALPPAKPKSTKTKKSSSKSIPPAKPKSTKTKKSSPKPIPPLTRKAQIDLFIAAVEEEPI